MKQTALAIITLGILLTGCDNKQYTLTQKDIHKKVDSIVSVKMQDINQQAKEDLESRIAIEVKPKADSIVQAMQTKGDKPVAPKPQEQDIEKAHPPIHTPLRIKLK